MNDSTFSLICPVDIQADERIQLAHGSGGKLTAHLIDTIFKPAFNNEWLAQDHDSASITWNLANIAVTTDAYVVNPLFFPGGDIGKLAIYGTCNDLAMAGAKPLFLTISFIIEEGLLIDELRKVVNSIASTAKVADVAIVAGDTKVVERGKADKLYLSCTGIGEQKHLPAISPKNINVGDTVIISGDIGRHGVAVLTQRDGLTLETAIESDCAPLWPLVNNMLKKNVSIHCMRDLTRGGLATALNELAVSAQVKISLLQNLIPVIEPVRAVTELFGLDPLYIANEGCCVLIIPENECENALAVMHANGFPLAKMIGRVSGGSGVTIKNAYGVERVLDHLIGDPLPRIC